MKMPTPQQLATAISLSSLSDAQKREILSSLPYLSDDRIVDLYSDVLSLLEEEKKFVKQVERVDFKYKMMVQQEMDRVAKSV